MKKNSTQVILLLVFAGIAVTSCIKDADDDELPTPPANEIPSNVDSTMITKDSVFKATAAYMQGIWMGQYQGYDLRQKTTSNIRRIVTFLPDGIYDSHVQGIVNANDSTAGFMEFEHEHGSYTFNAEKQAMNYSIEYDSLLNFETGKLEYSAGKMRPGGGLIKKYDESIIFSLEKEGKRDWIRTDGELVSPDNHSAAVIYIMNKQQ